MEQSLNDVIDTNNGASILESAMCLSLELSRIGTRRKVNPGEAAKAYEAEEDMIHVSKEILKSTALEDIKKLDGVIRTYVATKCLPAQSMFRSGVYLIPNLSVVKINNRLKEFKAQRESLVQLFMEEYDAVKKDAENRLGPIFDPSNYPDPEQVRSSFRMTFRYMTFDTPKKLKGIDPTVYAEELEKSRQSVAVCTQEIQLALRENLAKLVEHMFDKLSEKPDGSKKVFRNSSVEKIKEFLDDFNSKNITNDKELEELVNKARALMDGVEPEAL